MKQCYIKQEHKKSNTNKPVKTDCSMCAHFSVQLTSADANNKTDGKCKLILYISMTAYCVRKYAMVQECISVSECFIIIFS